MQYALLKDKFYILSSAVLLALSKVLARRTLDSKTHIFFLDGGGVEDRSWGEHN